MLTRRKGEESFALHQLQGSRTLPHIRSSLLPSEPVQRMVAREGSASLWSHPVTPEHSRSSPPMLPPPTSARKDIGPRSKSPNMRSKISFVLFSITKHYYRYLVALLLFLPIFTYLSRRYSSMNRQHRRNYVLAKTPDRFKAWAEYLYPFPWVDPVAPIICEEILNAPHPTGWKLPPLDPPNRATTDVHFATPYPLDLSFLRDRSDQLSHGPTPTSGPAFLSIHIFSSIYPKYRTRRDVIRKYSSLNWIPKEYQHLIDVKLILGKATPDQLINDPELRNEDERIDAEQGIWGDIVRLEGLVNGDNIDNGKSWEWLKWVGQEKGRKAWWVFKCDDDTIPILPNLLPYLTAASPRIPTYVGTSMGHHGGYNFYFEGMIYGFSWGVVKTLASANLDKSFVEKRRHEDARIGELLTCQFSLPSLSHCSSYHHPDPTHPPRPAECDPRRPPSRGWAAYPVSPDLRTGLVRLDLVERMGDYGHWWVAGANTAAAWHRLKRDDEYIDHYLEAMEFLDRKGKRYWQPPALLRRDAEKTWKGE